MKNYFNVDARYNVAQNISRLALANNHRPVYYSNLTFVESFTDKREITEHLFVTADGIKLLFEDTAINTNESEDNSVVIAEILSN